ncbi:MAG: hypothetical protein JWM93_1017 [Frankiales bacterium]|nr:hypothetical protein [Frankiales bacterium]
MRSELRTALAVVATTAVLLTSATMAIADGDAAEPEPTATTATTATTAEPTPEPTQTPPTVPSGAFTVDDAQLRWGVNDESNNKAFAPGTFNFFSAGKIPDPGRGGVILPPSSWKQSDGDVRIEKYLDGAWTPATYAGLKTTSAGAVMTGTNGPFSHHEVVISGGTGTVDPTAGRATIQWTGSFTVLYYSGYSFFYVTDPRLTVSGGVGTLTATLSGFGSSMDDTSVWKAIAPAAGVTLAQLGVVDLTKDLGFSATPAYRGVAVSVPAGQSPQVRSGSAWGSFPQSFVDYQVSSGSGAYWYSSGGSADAHKIAKPVTVSYAAGAPVKVAPPKKDAREKRPGPETDAPNAPSNTAVVPPAVSTPLLPGAAAAAPVAAAALRSGTALTQVRPVSTVLGAQPSADASDPTGLWLLGALLLAAAGLIAVSPFAHAAIQKTR